MYVIHMWWCRFDMWKCAFACEKGQSLVNISSSHVKSFSFQTRKYAIQLKNAILKCEEANPTWRFHKGYADVELAGALLKYISVIFKQPCMSHCCYLHVSRTQPPYAFWEVQADQTERGKNGWRKSNLRCPSWQRCREWIWKRRQGDFFFLQQDKQYCSQISPCTSCQLQARITRDECC